MQHRNVCLNKPPIGSNDNQTRDFRESRVVSFSGVFSLLESSAPDILIPKDEDGFSTGSNHVR